MPRRARRLLEHRSYHITHRCHDRNFLLKFIGERRRYLELLRQMARSYKVDVLGYMVTSNHVHLLLCRGIGVTPPLLSRIGVTPPLLTSV